MSLTLCVLLWAHEGHEAALIEYEDKVLPPIADHGGRVRQRARTGGSDGEPLEINLLQFPFEDALDAHMGDERRTKLVDARERSIARIEVLRVDLV